MSNNKLLSGWFQDVLSLAMVLPVFDIEGRDENYDFIWDMGPEDADEILVRDDGYSLEAQPGLSDEPLVIARRPDGEACGFYFGFQAWIDEGDRGKGLGRDMILAYADYFKDLAWSGSAADADQGLGFSEAGFAVHHQAYLEAVRRASVDPDMEADMETLNAPPAP